MLIRTTGDIIALSPLLIVERSQIDEIVGTIGEVLKRLGGRLAEAGNQPAFKPGLPGPGRRKSRIPVVRVGMFSREGGEDSPTARYVERATPRSLHSMARPLMGASISRP